MGKQISKGVFPYFASLSIGHCLRKDLPVRCQNFSSSVLCKQDLLASVIAVIDQFLFMGYGVSDDINGHGKKK